MASCESLFLRLLLSVPSVTRPSNYPCLLGNPNRQTQASFADQGTSNCKSVAMWKPWAQRCTRSLLVNAALKCCQSLIKRSPGSRKFQLEKVIACFCPPVTAQLYSPRALASLRPVQKYFWRDLSYFFIKSFKYSCSNLQKVDQSHKCLTVFAIKSTLPPETQLKVS